MKALLVSPESADSLGTFKHALPFEGKRSVFPLLGLPTVSSVLPKSWKQRLVDISIQPLNHADLPWADVVLVSAMLVQKASMLDVLERARRRGIPRVAGEAIRSCMADLPGYTDHLVVGKAQEVVAGMAADLECGRAKPTAPGMIAASKSSSEVKLQ